MSEAGWNGKTPAEIIADVSAIIEALPPLPDPMELYVQPEFAYHDWRKEVDAEIERDFRRRDPEMVLPMLDVIARRAAEQMLVFSREARF